VNRVRCRTDYNYAADEIRGGEVCTYSNAAEVLVDGCQGDSGGPLFVPSTGEVVGIIAWGEGCGLPDYPGVTPTLAGITVGSNRS